MRYGEPNDVAGECNARTYIGDNFGDNHGTMRCQLPKGHEGKHEETFKSDYPPDTLGAHEVTVSWSGCDREQERKWDEEDDHLGLEGNDDV
jgi:hypothetical protein